MNTDQMADQLTMDYLRRPHGRRPGPVDQRRTSGIHFHRKIPVSLAKPTSATALVNTGAVFYN